MLLNWHKAEVSFISTESFVPSTRKFGSGDVWKIRHVGKLYVMDRKAWKIAGQNAWEEGAAVHVRDISVWKDLNGRRKRGENASQGNVETPLNMDMSRKIATYSKSNRSVSYG